MADLKRKQMSANLNELKQCCEEQFAKMMQETDKVTQKMTIFKLLLINAPLQAAE